jgi:integrase
MKETKSGRKANREKGRELMALVVNQASDPALLNAVAFWTDATTGGESLRRQDIKRDKSNAVLSFFGFTGQHPAAVKPADVKAWQVEMEARGLAQTTVYSRICHLSSFFRWAMKDPALGQYLESNPVSYAHPKAPKPYQTRSAKALTEEQIVALLKVVGARARAGDLVGKRDYALLLLYITTGMRRSEVIGLKGREVTVEEKRIIIRSRVKGGDYQGREVTDPRVRAALVDYLRSSRRLHVLREDASLWTRHDGAGEPGAQLSSWSFVENLKRYGREAGIRNIHLHQTRHSFARMVAEQSGSLSETQDALGHRHASTTRIYVESIAVKKTHGNEVNGTGHLMFRGNRASAVFSPRNPTSRLEGGFITCRPLMRLPTHGLNIRFPKESFRSFTHPQPTNLPLRTKPPKAQGTKFAS